MYLHVVTILGNGLKPCHSFTRSLLMLGQGGVGTNKYLASPRTWS